MDMEKSKKDYTKLFYLFSVLHGLQFYWPTLMLYQKDKIGSFSSIALIQVFFNILVVFLEIPSGYLADKFGRKKSLNISVICNIIALILYMFLSNITTFLILEIFWAISTVTFSGTYQAFTYDTIIKGKNEELGIKIFSTLSSISAITLAISNIGGSIIANFLGVEYTFLITAIFFAVSIIVINFIPEISVGQNMANQKTVKLNVFFEENSELVKKILMNRELVINLIDMILLSGIIYISFYFSQTTFAAFRIPITYFGIIFCGINIIKSIVVKFSDILIKKINRKKLFLSIDIIFIFLFISVCFIKKAGYYIFVITVTQVLSEIRNIVYRSLNNKLIDSEYRATVLSYYSLINSALISILMLIFGILADFIELNVLYLLIGIACIVPFIFKVYILKEGKLS